MYDKKVCGGIDVNDVSPTIRHYLSLLKRSGLHDKADCVSRTHWRPHYGWLSRTIAGCTVSLKANMSSLLPKLLFIALAIPAPQIANSQQAPVPGEIQLANVREICERSTQNLQRASNSIAAQLDGLTGRYRERALNCLMPAQSFLIATPEILAILGPENSDSRAMMICRLTDNLAVERSSGEVVSILGDLAGSLRVRAILCLTQKLQSNLSAGEILNILGPTMPENDPAWSMMSYNFRHHSRVLCAVAPKLGHGLTSTEASRLLGLSRNRDRLLLLRCIVDHIVAELGWSDVEEILSASISHRGNMIDVLDSRTPDGRNYEKLKIFHSKFSTSRFLVDPDPPDWLLGQCVAWARLAYEEVSARPLRMSFGLARNIPAITMAAGFGVETNPQRARVGALAVWDDGRAGHVAVVTGIRRNRDTGDAEAITISEANWGQATQEGARQWGIALADAQDEIVTDMYGRFSSISFKTSQLDRPAPGAREPNSFRFIGYVLPE